MDSLEIIRRPGEVDVTGPMFDDEEAGYLLIAIETMKCDDCKGRCNVPCLYLSLKSKLEAIKEARHE